MSFSPLINATPYSWPLSGTWSAEDTAVIVIDMQRDFLSDDGYFASLGEDNSQLQRVIQPGKSLLDNLRKLDLLTIHTRESHRPELVDVNNNKHLKANLKGATVGSQGPLGRLLVRGEYGCDFHDDFVPKAGEIVIDKPGNSAFYATDLEHILRVKNIKNIILFGVTTDVCVSSTMREANDRGYDCVLVENCSAAATNELHQSVLRGLERESGIFGAYCTSDMLAQIELV